TRPAASRSRHSMAAASLSRSTFRSWMIRLRSTLCRLQEPGDVFVPPPRTLAGPDLQPVQLVGDLPQRLAGLPEPLNPLQDGLLARLRLHVAFVCGLPETVRRVADELQLRFLVPHRIPPSPSEGLTPPLADRDHHIQNEPTGGAAGVQRLGDRYQRDAPALELLQQDGQVLHGSGQPVQLGDNHHSYGPRLDHFEDADHAGPVEIFGAFTGVNQDVQKLDIMDGGHCLDLLHLGFQRNTPVSLLVCRNPYVAYRFCFHMLKKLNHTRGGSHKLSGYFGYITAWGPAKTPAGGTEASHRQHTERAATPATSFGEASPAKEQDKMKRPPKPLRALPGRLVSLLCAGHPTPFGECAQTRNRRPQSENGVHQEESAKVRGWGASLSDNAVSRPQPCSSYGHA